MKLQEESIRWAIEHLNKESDTDLFPKPFEINIINELKEETIEYIKNIDIPNYKWKANRRFLIPKDELSFRNITQLDPIDSILFAAMIYEYGDLIEKRRSKFTGALHTRKVFSNKFSPDPNGELFKYGDSWQSFWEHCKMKAVFSCNYVVVTDIADFYNQIYHHTIENQLMESSFPKIINKSIIHLLSSITQKNSRGIPIGPHVSHLLAELSLIPVDESLSLYGLKFCRYVDDIVIFCKTEEDARIAIYKLANILDKQQRLILQRQKTKIIPKSEFLELCELKLKEEPKNEIEEKIIATIIKKTGGDLYRKISLSNLSVEELKVLSKENLEALLNTYINEPFPDFSGIRWLYRRLAQLGTPNAIEFSIKNLKKLIPAINDVCLYLTSSSENYESNWKPLGKEILDLLKLDIIQANEFFQITILDLFSKNEKLNHFEVLINLYEQSPENIRRKILFVARINKVSSWISELKEQYITMSGWNKRAFLIATSILPKEERNFFLKGIKQKLQRDNYMEHLIIKWSNNQ